jgi:hypothetical protein
MFSAYPTSKNAANAKNPQNRLHEAQNLRLVEGVRKICALVARNLR